MSSSPTAVDALVDEKTFEQVESIGVFDEEGNERPFGGLIRHGRVCVVFIRHFGCGMCQDYLLDLKQHLSPEKLADRKLIIIGCGHWSAIKAYRELLECPFPIYSDNTRTLYDLLGMSSHFSAGDPQTEGKYVKQSLTATLVKSFTNGWKMGAKSFLNSGKISQQGGEFIFIDAKCVFAHRMQSARDHTEPEDLAKRVSQD